MGLGQLYKTLQPSYTLSLSFLLIDLKSSTNCLSSLFVTIQLRVIQCDGELKLIFKTVLSIPLILSIHF